MGWILPKSRIFIDFIHDIYSGTLAFCNLSSISLYGHIEQGYSGMLVMLEIIFWDYTLCSLQKQASKTIKKS